MTPAVPAVPPVPPPIPAAHARLNGMVSCFDEVALSLGKDLTGPRQRVLDDARAAVNRLRAVMAEVHGERELAK